MAGSPGNADKHISAAMLAHLLTEAERRADEPLVVYTQTIGNTGGLALLTRDGGMWGYIDVFHEEIEMGELEEQT